MIHVTCIILCWSANCHIWHPEESLDTCYCSLCPSQEQLPSTHCKWNNLLTLQIPPAGMQCQFSDAEPGPISHIGHVRAGSHQVSLIHAVACYNHSTNTTIGCSCDPRTKPCCPSLYSYSHDKGYPSAYTHLYIKCSTCATPTVRPCPYSTKMPDHRDVTEEVTAPGSMNDVLDPEYAWTILAICALSCWTLSLDKHYEVAHPESGPQLSHLTFIPNLIITCWKGGCYTTC